MLVQDTQEVVDSPQLTAVLAYVGEFSNELLFDRPGLHVECLGAVRQVGVRGEIFTPTKARVLVQVSVVEIDNGELVPRDGIRGLLVHRAFREKCSLPIICLGLVQLTCSGVTGSQPAMGFGQVTKVFRFGWEIARQLLKESLGFLVRFPCFAYGANG